MPDMNSTSASLYGSCPSPGGVWCRWDEGALAQPLPAAAANRHAASASRQLVCMATYGIRFGSGLELKSVLPVLWGISAKKGGGTPVVRAALVSMTYRAVVDFE